MATLEGITHAIGQGRDQCGRRVGALLAGGFATAPVVSADPVPVPSAPCYNGVFPLNPYVDNCALPGRPRRTLGSARIRPRCSTATSAAMP